MAPCLFGTDFIYLGGILITSC